MRLHRASPTHEQQSEHNGDTEIQSEGSASTEYVDVLESQIENEIAFVRTSSEKAALMNTGGYYRSTLWLSHGIRGPARTGNG